MDAPPTADVVVRLAEPILRLHGRPIDAFLERSDDGRWRVPSSLVLPTEIADPALELRSRFFSLYLLAGHVHDVVRAVTVDGDRFMVDGNRARVLLADRYGSILATERAGVIAENTARIARMIAHDGGATMVAAMVLSAHDASQLEGKPFFDRLLLAVFSPKP